MKTNVALCAFVSLFISGYVSAGIFNNQSTGEQPVAENSTGVFITPEGSGASSVSVSPKYAPETPVQADTVPLLNYADEPEVKALEQQTNEDDQAYYERTKKYYEASKAELDRAVAENAEKMKSILNR